jgi:3-oxoacyl-[acyl-carrier protein] reductase
LTARNGQPGFDILVNNSGVGKRAVIEHITEDEFDLGCRSISSRRFS